jgi:hypothetical protein
MLFQNGLRFVYLWGDLKPCQQEMCIKAFQQGPEIKVMVSVKQGIIISPKGSYQGAPFANISLPSYSHSHAAPMD